MSKKLHWLDRGIAKEGPYLILCLSGKEQHAVTRKLKQNKQAFPKSGAVCKLFSNTKHNDCCVVVSVAHSAQTKELPVVAGLLAHEAVHVWQEYAASIGEHTPGMEQEAYAVQAVFQTLFTEYLERAQCL